MAAPIACYIGTDKATSQVIQKIYHVDNFSKWQIDGVVKPDSDAFNAEVFWVEFPVSAKAKTSFLASWQVFVEQCRNEQKVIAMLTTTGYLHNHLRMYLASYVVHWRRVKWQAGARFMLNHLIDADAASNNLSWQWIASTYSQKPYIFNLENMQKYCGNAINTQAQDNQALDASYEVLTARLFPQQREMV